MLQCKISQPAVGVRQRQQFCRSAEGSQRPPERTLRVKCRASAEADALAAYRAVSTTPSQAQCLALLKEAATKKAAAVPPEVAEGALLYLEGECASPPAATCEGRWGRCLVGTQLRQGVHRQHISQVTHNAHAVGMYASPR